jgi:hypothetical protein
MPPRMAIVIRASGWSVRFALQRELSVVECVMGGITPEQARAYLKRWELVSQAEVAELRRTTLEIKLQQLAALMESRHLFGPEPDREAGVLEVRERWARLRRALGG